MPQPQGAYVRAGAACSADGHFADLILQHAPCADGFACWVDDTIRWTATVS
jgi:hypothetical protein